VTHFLSVQSSCLRAEGTQGSLRLCSTLRCLLGAHDKQRGRSWWNQCSHDGGKSRKHLRPCLGIDFVSSFLSELALLKPTHADNTSTHLSTHEAPTPPSLQVGAETRRLPGECSHGMLEVRTLLAPLHTEVLLTAFPLFIDM